MLMRRLLNPLAAVPVYGWAAALLIWRHAAEALFGLLAGGC
jgi:hypothetical protein